MSIGDLHKIFAQTLVILPIAIFPILCYNIYRKKAQGGKNENLVKRKSRKMLWSSYE
jgi:hypothetical protein